MPVPCVPSTFADELLHRLTALDPSLLEFKPRVHEPDNRERNMFRLNRARLNKNFHLASMLRPAEALKNIFIMACAASSHGELQLSIY